MDGQKKKSVKLILFYKEPEFKDIHLILLKSKFVFFEKKSSKKYLLVIEN